MGKVGNEIERRGASMYVRASPITLVDMLIACVSFYILFFFFILKVVKFVHTLRYFRVSGCVSVKKYINIGRR